MTRPASAPSWLAELQTHFGSVLRTPLDRTTGSLAATPDAYPTELVADADAMRLSLYNRQYWFRLFEVVQDAFPLTARLLGFWTFNHFASRYLVDHPPAGWDIDRVADGFAAAFATDPDARARDDFAPLSEAAVLDAAYRDVFRAPIAPPYQPTAADAPKLATSRLLLSPGLRIVRETSPLVALRQRIVREPELARVPLPPPHPVPQSWAIICANAHARSVQALPLEEGEADLLGLLADFPLEGALARLEAAQPTADARAELPERTRQWLARAVKRSFFVGLAPDA